MGWSRSETVKGFNVDVEIEALGPPKAAEVRQLAKEIRADGGNYIAVPSYRGDWPLYTTGRDAMANQAAAEERKAATCGKPDCPT
jgi:hypothetical protein